MSDVVKVTPQQSAGRAACSACGGAGPDEALHRKVSRLDSHVHKVDKRLAEVQRGIDNIMWVLAKQRLDSVQEKSRDAREGRDKTPVPEQAPRTARELDRKAERHLSEYGSHQQSPASRADSRATLHHDIAVRGAARQQELRNSRGNVYPSNRAVEARASAGQVVWQERNRERRSPAGDGRPYRNTSLANRQNMLVKGSHSPTLLPNMNTSHMGKMNKMGSLRDMGMSNLNLTTYDFPSGSDVRGNATEDLSNPRYVPICMHM